MSFWDEVKEQIDSQKNRRVDVDEQVRKTAEAIKEHYMSVIRSRIRISEEKWTKPVDTISFSDFLVLESPWVTEEYEDVALCKGERRHNVWRAKTNKFTFEFNAKLKECLAKDKIAVGTLQKISPLYSKYDMPMCVEIGQGSWLCCSKDIKVMDGLSVRSDAVYHYIDYETLTRKRKYYSKAYVIQESRIVYSCDEGKLGRMTGMSISFQYHS